MTHDWYREEIAAAAARLGADLRRGLAAGEAVARRKNTAPSNATSPSSASSA